MNMEYDTPIERGQPGWIPNAKADGNDLICGSERYYMCTRSRGHVGDHAAHGINGHLLAVWAQEEGHR